MSRIRQLSTRRLAGLLLLLSFLAGSMFGPAVPADAHAMAERYVPEPGSRLEAAPRQAAISFNEAVEIGAGSLRVLDAQSRDVGSASPVHSEDRRTVLLELPRLEEGVYTVTFSVISADGHPVSGSYPFIIGNPPEAMDASSFNLHAQLGHRGHSASTQLTMSELLIYLTRIVYYAALLLATGLMLWQGLMRKANREQHETMGKWGLWTVRGLLVSTLLYVFIHARELMLYQPLSEWGVLFTQTTIGMIWFLLLAVALLGFVVLRARAIVKIGWAIILLALETWNGHAVAYEPGWYALGLNFLHAAASAVWAGGLALLLALWLADRKEAGRFAERFSAAAWLSIVILTVSGLLSTLLFLPQLSYLFYTAWGKVLIAKTVFVGAVIVTGALLRRQVKRKDLPSSTLLKVDAGLMAAILIAVGIFTYISPLPANEPLNRHLMGEDQHITLRISPNVPGENTFIVKIWQPEEIGEPKFVRLLLRPADASVAPIEVELTQYDDQELDSFTGYVKATYEAEGPYLPFPGEWEAEIRYFSQENVERIHSETFRIY